MALKDVVEIARSQSLMSRVAACAANEGIDNPQAWVQDRSWKVAATPGWSDKWSYALDTLTVNQNPDIGMRDDVINDQDILSAVQTIVTEEQGDA
jgi:hypothetical protein